MITVFLGAPGTGKGTIASILKQENNFIHISTGNLFRHHMKNKTELGKKVKEIIDGGNLVDDQTTFELLEDKLNKIDLDNSQIILDGYPRTIFQAELLSKYIKDNEVKFETVINFNVDNKTILKRLTGRLMCPSCGRIYHKEFLKPQIEGKCDDDDAPLIQREDDRKENILVRLEAYENLTLPLVKYYNEKGMLVNVEGHSKISEIKGDILNVIG